MLAGDDDGSEERGNRDGRRVTGHARGAGAITLALGGVPVLAAWLGGGTSLPTRYAPAAELLAEVLAVVCVLLAWRFRHSRLAVAAVVVAAANACIRGPLGAELGGDPGPVVALLAVLLPLNLGLLAPMGDRSLARPVVMVHLGLVALQGLGAVVLVGWPSYRQGAVAAVLESPQAALLAVLFALSASLVAFILRRGGFEGGLLWAVAAGYLALVGSADPTRAAMTLSAAQLALLLGAVEDSSRLAFDDQLTGLPGRRASDDALRALTGDYAGSMVDIDHFKRFNDRWGHEAGDQALRMVADELRDLRGGARAYRYGGEEFAILFPSRPAAEAEPHVERLRVRISARPFAIRSAERPRSKPKRPRPSRRPPRRVKLTVSIGLAGPAARRPTPEDVLRAADRALYRAKTTGRNRVVRA